MKKLSAVLVGAGNRGCTYAGYSLEAPEELEIVAVVEPNRERRVAAEKNYNIPENRCFSCLEDFLTQKIKCDFVINATMDEFHYETAKQILLNGYNMLLEKPIVSEKKQLLELKKIANDRNLRVLVCHVLRYTPFYKSIKEIIDSGKIGEILTMEMNEHVWIGHFLDSYVRGKWKSKKQCGSGFLLAKSCHDIDIMCWLNNATKPKEVSSFGSRSLFIKENAPKGAMKYCYNCPHNETCLYSAQKVHLEYDGMPFQTWAGMGKPIDQITKEEKAEWLKTSEYGLCAYDAGGDINDRQSLQVRFENGSVGTFTMVGGCSESGRFLHICGSRGEIEGSLEDGKFLLRYFKEDGKNKSGIFGCIRETIDINNLIHKSENYAGHAGGDYAIMYEIVRYFNGDDTSVSITNINDSVNGHLVVYAAEESNKKHKIIKL